MKVIHIYYGDTSLGRSGEFIIWIMCNHVIHYKDLSGAHFNVIWQVSWPMAYLLCCSMLYEPMPTELILHISHNCESLGFSTFCMKNDLECNGSFGSLLEKNECLYDYTRIMFMLAFFREDKTRSGMRKRGQRFNWSVVLFSNSFIFCRLEE